MPALPITLDATAAQPDSLAPRHLDLDARQPTIDAAAPNSLLARQSIQPGIIPTYYNYSGPAAGTVVGLVLGSVAAFLLVCWLFYSLTLLSGSGGGATIAGEEEIVVRRRRGSQGNSGRSRRSTRTEVREYSRSPARREQVIVEERRRSAPRPRSIVVEERIRVPGDDMVEVIEEHDEYRTRRGPRRSGGYR
ncbi:hypothetical protein K505DRAFT_328171 [Melanomma pulvis-pyrius CBS 109.77]|uniref:Uncharacterized protein n=1 Tax=Melanomma pulvis-pyrius CBS 109.77 TaxID=1314802 RepID=A0A6A6X008_9PLEO|nr:hypothetical protein K505DRAFT_328171 [Melanomma pulvis-pyrius CBS 109.77]